MRRAERRDGAGRLVHTSAPLFMYVAELARDDRGVLADFVRFTLENAAAIAKEAQFVPLNQEQVDAELQKLEDATVTDVGRRHCRPARRHGAAAEEDPVGKAVRPPRPVHRGRDLGADDCRIVLSLLLPALEFFGEVSPLDFFTGTTWAPLFSMRSSAFCRSSSARS